MLPIFAQRPRQSHGLDAVVVVPGIMGSALKDTRGDVWGFSDPMTYVKLWSSRSAMPRLGFTQMELEALATDSYDPATARVQPAGLISSPSFAPILAGLEPYSHLVSQLTAATHDAAVLEFAYDWRLPIRLNSRLLAQAMKEHLARWRRHQAHAALRQQHPEQRDAEIIIVAHSMGGLVVQGLADPVIEDGFQDVRKVITLGTPFYGSVKAATILAHGEGAPVPLPRRRLAEAARTMPGLYDLLPRNRCLLRQVGARPDVVALGVEDVVGIGGNEQLAQRAASDFLSRKPTTLPGHRPIVGVAQPTWQSLEIMSGAVHPKDKAYRWDKNEVLMRGSDGVPLSFNDMGDGTVWRYAARPKGSPEAESVAQQHGALAKSGEGVQQVVAIVTDLGDLGVLLGGGGVGIDAPDTVAPETRFTVTVTGEVDPALVTGQVVDVGTSRKVREIRLRRADADGLRDELILDKPGLYRVEVQTDAGHPVTQIVMVAPNR